MSISSLVNVVKISPNSSPRTTKISAITIHYMAIDSSVEACGAGFSSASRRASSNYGIDSKGRVGLYVDESRRSWCSSNTDNDNRAITIEVANCSKAPEWKVSQAALEKTIQLCVDICERNNIPYLEYTGDESGNLTMHCWFANTGCPGPYLVSQFHQIANEVNKRLGRNDKANFKLVEPFKIGEKIAVLAGAKYNSGQSCPSFFLGRTFYVREVMGNYIKISTQKTGAVSGVVHKKYLKSLEKPEPSVPSVPKEENETEPPKKQETELKLGDKVRLKEGARYYNNGSIPSWVFSNTLYVRRIQGDRITFSIFATGAVTGDTHVNNLIKV